MDKFNADRLAIKIASKILSTDPNAIFGNAGGGSYGAEAVADFIKTLSTRLQSDVDQRILDNVLDKN